MRLDPEEARSHRELDSDAELVNEQLEERARRARLGLQQGSPEVTYDALDDSDRYDHTIQTYRSDGDLKIVVKRCLPTRDDTGTFFVTEVPDWGALTDYVRRYGWNGQESEYKWSIKNRGIIRGQGKLKFDASPRIMREVEQGLWPLPFPIRGATRAPLPAPAPPPTPERDRFEEPRGRERGYDRDPRDRDRESDLDRADREYRERERDRDRDRDGFDRGNDRDMRREMPAPAPAAPVERVIERERESPMVSRLFDEISDMRQQMAAERREFAEMLTNAVGSRREEPAPRFQEPQAPATPTAPVDPLAQFTALGAAVGALQSTAGALGMVPGSALAELQRKSEAQQLKLQMDALMEKIALLSKPAPPAPAPPPAPEPPEPEEKELTPEQELAKRTRQAGPLTFVDKVGEPGETDWAETAASSLPGLLALFEGLQAGKNEKALEQLKIINANNEAMKKNNDELERQAKVMRDYADVMQQMKEQGIEMSVAEPAEESAGSTEQQPVDSEDPLSRASPREEAEASPAS